MGGGETSASPPKSAYEHHHKTTWDGGLEQSSVFACIAGLYFIQRFRMHCGPVDTTR